MRQGCCFCGGPVERINRHKRRGTYCAGCDFYHAYADSRFSMEPYERYSPTEEFEFEERNIAETGVAWFGGGTYSMWGKSYFQNGLEWSPSPIKALFGSVKRLMAYAPPERTLADDYDDRIRREHRAGLDRVYVELAERIKPLGRFVLMKCGTCSTIGMVEFTREDIHDQAMLGQPVRGMCLRCGRLSSFETVAPLRGRAL